jgi:hypothetical protein
MSNPYCQEANRIDRPHQTFSPSGACEILQKSDDRRRDGVLITQLQGSPTTREQPVTGTAIVKLASKGRQIRVEE